MIFLILRIAVNSFHSKMERVFHGGNLLRGIDMYFFDRLARPL